MFLKSLVLFSRIRARLIRNLIGFLRVRDDYVETLVGGDCISSESFEILQKYSDSSHLVSRHPRTNLDEQMSFPQRNIITIEHIEVDTSNGILFTAKKKVIAESTSWPKELILLNSIPKPLITKHLDFSSDRQVLLLASNGFYHWLYEDLPAFLFASENSKNQITLVHENVPSFVQSFLPLIPGEIVRVPRFVSLNSLTFTSRGGTTGWLDPVDRKMLRTFFAKHIKGPIPNRKVYISRLKSSRSPSFEEELISKLAKDGWLILETESMAVLEQIETISTAEILCGVSGAGLSGAVWLNQNAKVIELSPKRFIPAFSRMCHTSDLEYIRIGYEEPPLSLGDLLNQIQQGVK